MSQQRSVWSSVRISNVYIISETFKIHIFRQFTLVNLLSPVATTMISLMTTHSSTGTTSPTSSSITLASLSCTIWTTLLVGLLALSFNNDSRGITTVLASAQTATDLGAARAQWEATKEAYGPLTYSFGIVATVETIGDATANNGGNGPFGSGGGGGRGFDEPTVIVRVEDDVVMVFCGDEEDYPMSDEGITVEGIFGRIDEDLADESVLMVDAMFDAHIGHPTLIISTTTTTRTSVRVESFMLWNVIQINLDAAQALWDSAGIADYTMLQQTGCNFCNPLSTFPKRVQVQGNEIVSVVDANTGLTEESEFLWRMLKGLLEKFCLTQISIFLTLHHPVPSPPEQFQLTVQELFDRVQSSIDSQYYFIAATFNDTWGFPSAYASTNHPGLSDGGISYRFWDLQVVAFETGGPTTGPTSITSTRPSTASSFSPSSGPTSIPSTHPSPSPSSIPSPSPSTRPTFRGETFAPTISVAPTNQLSSAPSSLPTMYPSQVPSEVPSLTPSLSLSPSLYPTNTSFIETLEVSASNHTNRIWHILNHSWTIGLIMFMSLWIVLDFETAVVLLIVSVASGMGMDVLALV